MTTPRQRYALLLEDCAAPGDSPPAVRMRLALKSLLRRLGWKCLAVQGVAGGDRRDIKVGQQHQDHDRLLDLIPDEELPPGSPLPTAQED